MTRVGTSGKDFAYWIAGIFTGDLPKIVVEGAGGGVSDITIHGNTLEDVFICLTGRELRE
jgi:hypothetical protein